MNLKSVLKHCVKLLQSFSKHSAVQQVSAYNRSFSPIIQSHNCKEILFSLLQAKKIGDAVLLYVFNIGFPASLFRPIFPTICPTLQWRSRMSAGLQVLREVMGSEGGNLESPFILARGENSFNLNL